MDRLKALRGLGRRMRFDRQALVEALGHARIVPPPRLGPSGPLRKFAILIGARRAPAASVARGGWTPGCERSSTG